MNGEGQSIDGPIGSGVSRIGNVNSGLLRTRRGRQPLPRSRDRVKRIFRGAGGWQILTLEGMTVGPRITGRSRGCVVEHFEDTLVPKKRPAKKLPEA